MVQNFSLSDLQPGVYPSHFAPGKAQIFIEMFFLIQNSEGKKKKQMEKYKYWIIKSYRARESQNNFSCFYQVDNIHM